MRVRYLKYIAGVDSEGRAWGFKPGDEDDLPAGRARAFAAAETVEILDEPKPKATKAKKRTASK